MADVDAALGQKVLDLAQRQRDPTYIITTVGISAGERSNHRNGLPDLVI